MDGRQKIPPATSRTTPIPDFFSPIRFQAFQGGSTPFPSSSSFFFSLTDQPALPLPKKPTQPPAAKKNQPAKSSVEIGLPSQPSESVFF
jgi:hypothetical protein